MHTVQSEHKGAKLNAEYGFLHYFPRPHLIKFKSLLQHWDCEMKLTQSEEGKHWRKKKNSYTLLWIIIKSSCLVSLLFESTDT